MGVGKYSPTVNDWYAKDQEWHDRHCEPDHWIDRDGYDSYGYHHKTERDRAGYTEFDYVADGRWESYGDEEEYVHPLYERIYHEWSNKPFPQENS